MSTHDGCGCSRRCEWSPKAAGFFIPLPARKPTKANQEATMRLRRNQLCPIHRSHFCCGREAIPREKRQRQMGVRRIEDPHHPRGYRELRSNGEMRKLLDRKIVAQNGICALCKETVHQLRRRRTRPHPSPRHGRSVARRPSGQHPGCPLVVQWGKGIEQRVISGRCAIFLSLHDRIDPETRKRDPHHAGIKKLPSAFMRTLRRAGPRTPR